MCDCCMADRICAGHYRHFCPSCVFCGGRLLNRIGRVQALSTEILQRRRAALKVWMDWGHAETELRALAKAHESLQPIAKQLKARK